MEDDTRPLDVYHYDVQEWKRQQRQRGRPPWETAPFPIVREAAPEPEPTALKIVALVPAHNEGEHIAGTIASLLRQSRPPDEIIIISDNSTDRTVAIASEFPAPVRVIETKGNKHRKSGALNLAWNTRCQDADIVVCADGDTEMPPDSVRDWELEFLANEELGGSSSQPVMTGLGFLPRMQRYEFARSSTQTLARGWCRVISGTGCAFRNEALREAARLPGQAGPWTYESVVEDYHLTYRLRRLGWHCAMSPTVICYTGSMKTLKSLWAQRIKWEAGTCADLLRFGCNKLNYREWLQRGYLFLNLAFWVLWLTLNVGEAVSGSGWHLSWPWESLTLFLMVTEYVHVRRMRSAKWPRDWKDTLLAVSLVHMFAYNALAIAWGMTSWWKVLTGQMGDLWAGQYRAEGMQAENMKIGVGS